MTDLAVIMSVYRNDKIGYLKEAIQSIIDQTFTNFHLYIVVDGPVESDFEEYLSAIRDNRIRLFRLEKNGGLARALNFLLEIVMKNQEYKFIARMDADDISLPDRFNKQHNFLSLNTGISCVGCWYQEINESGMHLSDVRLPTIHEKIKKIYYIRSPFAHPSVMFRRDLIELSGFYPTDTMFMEDNVLWGNALKAKLQFANIPEYLFKFRRDDSFYKRRSGVRYGWNFMLTRFKINRSLNSPFYSYIFSFLIGVIKMMPSFVLRFIYLVAGRKVLLS